MINPQPLSGNPLRLRMVADTIWDNLVEVCGSRTVPREKVDVVVHAEKQRSLGIVGHTKIQDVQHVQLGD